MFSLVHSTHPQQMLPEWLLVVSLVILLGYTAQTTLDKAFKVHQKETEAQLKAA